MVIVVIELIFVVYQYGSLANSTVSTVLFYWLKSVRWTSDGFEIVIEVFLVPELFVYKFVSAVVHKQLHYIEVVRSTISNCEIHIQLQIWYNYNLMIQTLTFIMSTLLACLVLGTFYHAWIASPYKTHLSHSLIHQRNIVHSAVSTRVWCSQCYLLETRIDRQENQFNDYNHQLLNTNISWKTQRILYTTTNFLFWKKKS